MSKKRRSSAESEAPAGKEKAPEFNGTVFKTMLTNPTTATKGLERFTSTAAKLPCAQLYDVVEGYIKISTECSEIFKLLEAEKPPESEMMLVFGSLEAILLRTASDLSHFNLVGNVLVKKIASNHAKLLQGSFYSANHGFIRQCLNLLSAMVSQGAEAAREVFSHVQIKSFFGLAKRKDKRGKPDVRLAFIQFVLSFLMSGDSAVIGQVLEVKEFLPHILNTGLKEDRMSTVNLILSTLKTRVVLNKAISKTQKVRFFTPAVLASIAALYKWNGIADATADDDPMVVDSDAAAVSVVRDLVHGFLVDVCCSRKHGISFHDPSFGTSGRPGNVVLLQFLVGLKQATEDELVAELVVNILKESPDILSRFFKENQYSFTPRIRSAWQDNVKLLKRIYEAQPAISTIFQTGEVIPLPRLLSMIMAVSLPPVCNKAFFIQGLNLANPTVQLTTVSVINFILKKANENIKYLSDKSAFHKSDLYAAEMTEELVQQYRESIGKILPDMTLIISTWQSLSKKEKVDGADETKSDRLTDDKNKLPVAEKTEVIVLKAFILQVICLYQKVVPHLITQSKFDFSKLLKGIVSDKGMREEIPPVLQYHILQLALELPASKFSWFRLQDVVNSESSSGEKSVLYLLLKMFVSSSNHLSSTTRKLVLKVLRDTGVFEYTLAELDLWLDKLARVQPEQQETVIQFLERVLVKLVCNSHDYTDRVAGFVQDAANLQANLSVQEGEAASVPVSHIDDVLDMLDVIMEGNDGDVEEFGPSLSEEIIIQTFPFSAVVPAALEARNKLSADKGVVCEYLSAVLSDVLHCQRDPFPLCLALQQYDKELVSSRLPLLHQSIADLHHYYSRWLPQHCREELFKSPESLLNELAAPSSYSSLIKAAYIQGPGALLQDAFRQNAEKALAVMSLTEFPVLIKQILLYIKSTVEIFGKFSKQHGDAFLRTLMEMLQEVLTKLQGFEETACADPATKDSQEGSNLFLELNQTSTTECNKEQIVVSALGSVFKHPCLEQWFLALELAALPPHSLKPVSLKRLCAQLTDHILTLLNTSGPTLDELNHLELISSYMGAIERAALKELVERGSHPAKTYSKSFQALLSLHGYMDSSNLRELVSRLLQLPHESLICPSSEELSIYGRVALQIVTKSYSAASQNQNPFLTQAHLHGLGTLLLSCSSPELEAFLLQALSSKPESAKLIHTDVLLHCLQRSLPNSLAIGSLLLQNCSSHRLCFEVWCEEPTNMGKMSETKAFLPLINAYLKVAQKEDPARPKDVQQEVLKTMKQALFHKFSLTILGDLTEDPEVQLIEAAASLIKLSADVNDIRDLIDNLPDALQKADSFERWSLVDVITEKLADCTEEQEKWRRSVVAAALKRLIASFCHSKDQAASQTDQEQEQGILRRLQQLLKSAEDIIASDWNCFVKNGLKYRYCNQHFLNTLSNLLDVMYGSTEYQKDLIPLSTLHMMTTSHSQFLPVMLDSSEETNKDQAKEALVSLLLCLVRKCPKVCNINHFIVLLAAYGASLSTSDQHLLTLLQLYERSQVSLLKFQSLLWGPGAVEHHKTRKTLGASLWKQPSSDDVLALLKGDKMLQTILKFPQERRLIPQIQEGTQLLYLNDAAKNHGDLYDPCFLLPLFSAILQPECVVDCLKFVSCHALGVTVMALSSFDPNMRAAAYHVLACFYQHLEGARFREKRQLLYLMDNFKNGIPKLNQKLPFVLAMYICKVAQQMLRPEDHMYLVLNRFLLSHQSLDLRRVPEFFKLFYSFEMEHKLEREWILMLLEEGIKDGHSYELCNHQSIFQVLLGFSSSPLCSEHVLAQIIKVLCQAARVPKAVYNLTKSCGLLSWIIQTLDKKNVTQQTICAVINLLHALWFTNLGQLEKKVTQSTKKEPARSAKCLPLPLIGEFLYVASAISRHLRLGVKAAQLSLFAQTLDSVLVHQGAALSVNKQADRPTLHPQPLSSTETLSLLLCWASLSHNSGILTQIQALSKKHKLKEIMGMGKHKVQSKGRFALRRMRDESSSEDSLTVKQEEDLLAGCRVHLASVFGHWEPVFQLTELHSAQPGDALDSGHLARDTAYLLTKWSLRWLVEDTYDEDGTKRFLTWFEKAALKHREAVDVLMLDSGFKADLLQLFHHTFEASSHSSISARMKTCRVFTNIMICLLEMQGELLELHRAIIAACMPDQDQSRHEPGLFLLSLCIHELWSGAPSADLFLSHVGLVTGAKCNRQKGSKSSGTQTALRAICSDIIKMKS